MKRIVAFLLALVMLLTLSACGGGAGSVGEPKCNHYNQVKWISGREEFDEEGAALTLYEDGSGQLDLNLYRYVEGYEPDDVVTDPVSCVMYAVDDGTAYPYEEREGQILVYRSADSVYVFEQEGKGFDIGTVRSDALEELAKSSEMFASFAAIMNGDWIHIKTPEEFIHIADDLAGKYILDLDIDDWWNGESTVFTPIGSSDKPFTGELNGNGHKITGTLAYTGQEEAWGLFGCNAGNIHDLTVGYIACGDMKSRNDGAWESGMTYTSVDGEGLPVERTRYYGTLCGINRGTLKNIRFEDRADVPELNLYPNENDTIYAGIVCAFNGGTVSGVHIFGTSLGFRTLDKYTAADLGVVCGYQTAEAVLEDVSLEHSYIDLDTFGKMLNVAPAVNAGLLIGEAESGTTILGPVSAAECSVSAHYSLTDADLRFGGLVGRIHGDIELSGIKINDINVRIDARTDEDGYIPGQGKPLAVGGLIGWADGNVTLSDIQLKDTIVDVIRRRGGEPYDSYAGGIVAWCGGELTAQSVTMKGGDSSVDVEPEQGDGYAGGLSGYTGGSADVSDSTFSVKLSPVFNGDTLYEANVLGYVGGDAAFRNVQADCGSSGYIGETSQNSLIVGSRSTYYLAALAGAAEGTVTAEGCVVDVHYSLFGTPGRLYDGGSEGLYNSAN